MISQNFLWLIQKSETSVNFCVDLTWNYSYHVRWEGGDREGARMGEEGSFLTRLSLVRPLYEILIPTPTYVLTYVCSWEGNVWYRIPQIFRVVCGFQGSQIILEIFILEGSCCSQSPFSQLAASANILNVNYKELAILQYFLT